MPLQPSKADREVIDPKIKKFEDIEKDFRPFHEKIEENYKAYHGILESRSDAARWRSRKHTPFAHNIIETFVSNVVDDSIRFQVMPRARLTDLAEIEAIKQATKGQEILLNYQLENDRFSEKQRWLVLQAAIARFSVLKTYWKYDRADVPFYHTEVEGFDAYRRPVERQVQSTREIVVHDDPTAEIVDSRDFFYPINTVNMQTMECCFHRVWKSWDELKRLESLGIYQNVDQLKESRGFSLEAEGREQSVWGYERTKDKIEVLEYWTSDQTCTIANRKVLLTGPRENPFQFAHLPHRFPFQIVSSMPDIFRMMGMSEVDLIKDLQQMIWSLMNQRMDNTEISSNAIIMMRSDLEDPDAYEFAPGEKWLVDDPSQIKWFEINPQTSRMFLEAEQLLKGDLQTITGGLPLLSGAETSTLDNRTATGVSIFTSLAQKLLAVKKQQFLWAYERLGNQWIAMNSQFMDRERLIPIIGKDGVTAFEMVFPTPYASELKVRIKPASESLIRQERRAEKQAMLQTAGQLAPIMQAVGSPFNMKAFAEDWLESWDVQDKERYFSAMPQAAVGGPQSPSQAGGIPQQPSGAPEPGTGFTSPQAVSPLAPSNPTSMSPELFLQQLGALGGGPNNIG